MIKRKNGKKKGFSLIELIIVLAVMAIIALIAIPNFSAVRDNSKKKADTQSCATIERTVLMLVSDDTVKTAGTLEVTAPIAGTAGAYTGVANATGSSITAPEIQKVAEALLEVNAPQQSGRTKYQIVIDSNQKVTVTTIS